MVQNIPAPKLETPEEALDFVTQVTNIYLGTKGDHANLDTAIAILKDAITPKPESKV